MVPEGVPEPQADLHPVHRHPGVVQHLSSQLYMGVTAFHGVYVGL